MHYIHRWSPVTHSGFPVLNLFSKIFLLEMKATYAVILCFIYVAGKLYSIFTYIDLIKSILQKKNLSSLKNDADFFIKLLQIFVFHAQQPLKMVALRLILVEPQRTLLYHALPTCRVMLSVTVVTYSLLGPRRNLTAVRMEYGSLYYQHVNVRYWLYFNLYEFD